MIALRVESLARAWMEWWSSCGFWARWMTLVLVAALNAVHLVLGGWRSDHALLGAALLVLYYGGPLLRALLRWVLPLLLMLIVYDLQRYWVGALRGTVHVKETLNWELSWFGIPTAAGLATPAAWLQLHTYALLDLACGAAYLLFVPAFILCSAWWCFRRGRAEGRRIMWAYFWLNLAAFIVYLIYPAAPPWYVDRHGIGPALLDALPEAAGAARFDAQLGVSWFANYYARNSNVFGAIPSLHVAVPFLLVLYSFLLRELRIFSLLGWLLVFFASVYLNHHYIVDGIAGVFCATLVFAMVEGRKILAQRAARF